MIQTYIDDDGSTLSWEDSTGAVWATESPYVNQSSAAHSPASVSAGASTWEQVLQQGFSRVIDAKIRPVRPENTAPILRREGSAIPGQFDFAGLLPWLLIGGVALLVVGKMAK